MDLQVKVYPVKSGETETNIVTSLQYYTSAPSSSALPAEMEMQRLSLSNKLQLHPLILR